MNITHMQVNHIDTPLGFALGEPTFTWAVENALGTCAVASRVVVTRAGETVGDTGWADLSGVATQIPGLGAKLAPRTRYEWEVSVRTDAGDEASARSWFETAKLDEPWVAHWLTCDYDEPRHPVFSKRLDLAGTEVVSARLYIVGLGLYRAYIGGAPVSDEVLAPGTHAFDQWIQYQTYDVTSLVANGAELSVELGHGWYSGRFGFVKSDTGYYGNDWRLIAELRIAYADGTEQVIGTDESWQVTRSHVTFSNIYDGEHVDLTLPEVASVAATLLPAEKAAAATTKLHARLSLPVRAHETFSATLVDNPAGETVVDLGQNIAGTFRLRVRGVPAGATIRVQVGELLQGGNFYRDNLRTAKAEYVVVCDGDDHVVEPKFTFYGYRYARLEIDSGPWKNFDPTDFTGIALYSDFDAERGRLTTGNAKVNQLISNARWGMRGNFLDTATDCPQRDERMGWTGDANVFSGTAMRLAAPYAFYRKYLYDMALEQRTAGGLVPLVVPSYGLKQGAAVWGDATCRIPWNMYEVDGDPAILAEHYDAMRGWVDWVEGVDGDDHGWGRAFQFGDWLALDGRGANDRRGGTDEGLVAYLSWWDSALTVAAAADALDRADDAAHYRELAARIRAWIEAEYYTATGRCAVNTQTAYVLSIVYGFGNREWSRAQLRKLLEDNDGKLATGFVGTPLLCPALSRVGMDREAYQLLLGEEYPGWLYCVNLGATTIWERWNSLDANGVITGIDMNSMNHYSYGAIVEWMFTYAAGLVLLEPGFARVRLAPRVDWRLGSLEAVLRSAAGTWRVAWECEGEARLRVSFTVPFGAQAEVELPFAPNSAYDALGGRTLGPGTHEVAYDTTEPLRRVPSADWTIAQILATPDVSTVVKRYVDGFDWAMMQADQAATLREAQAAGLGQNHKMGADELAACDEALRALADRRP